MELPFYYTYKEFEKEYIFDFEEFKNYFVDFEDYLTHQLERVNKEYERLSDKKYELSDMEKEQFGKIDNFVEVASEKLASEILEKFSQYFPSYEKGESTKDYFLKVRLGIIKLNAENVKNAEGDFLSNRVFKASLKVVVCLNLEEIESFIISKLLEIKNIKQLSNNKSNLIKRKLSNPKKLALLHELGIFELPIMKNLSEDKQNEIIGLLLDADKTEFVYKNRLNINSKNPNYQIDKYGSYKYLDEMGNLLKEM